MIPAQFEYERPSSLQAVLTLLGDDTGDSVLLGGGHSLVPLLKLRMATPDRVIDLGGLQAAWEERFMVISDDGEYGMQSYTRAKRWTLKVSAAAPEQNGIKRLKVA